MQAIIIETSEIEKADAPVCVKVWDWPTRIFHWLTVVSFAGAYLTAESERWRDVHVMLGYTLAGLLIFRLVWGIVGSRYARFSSFMFSPSRVVAYLGSLLSERPQHYLGHNPAGALAIFILLGLIAAMAVSGIALYQEIGGDWLEEMHEMVAEAMLAVVVVHLAGVFVSSFLHQENLVGAMITGNKRVPKEESDAGITVSHGIIGAVMLVMVFSFGAVYLQDRLMTQTGMTISGQAMEHARSGSGDDD